MTTTSTKRKPASITAARFKFLLAVEAGDATVASCPGGHTVGSAAKRAGQVTTIEERYAWTDALGNQHPSVTYRYVLTDAGKAAIEASK